MTLEEAKKILGKAVQPGGLKDGVWYLEYVDGDTDAVLDGRFEPEDLEAIAAYMRSTFTGGAMR